MKLNLLLEQFLLEEWVSDLNMKKHWLKHCVGIETLTGTPKSIIDELINNMKTLSLNRRPIKQSTIKHFVREANKKAGWNCCTYIAFNGQTNLCFARYTNSGIIPMPFEDFKDGTDAISNAISFNYTDIDKYDKLVVFAPWKEIYSDGHYGLSSIADVEGNCVGYISDKYGPSSYVFVMDRRTAHTFLPSAYIPQNAYVHAVVTMTDDYKFVTIYPSLFTNDGNYKDFGSDIDNSFINPVFVNSHIKNFMKSASNYCRNALVSLLMDAQYRERYLSGYYDELIATLKGYERRGDLSKQIFNTQSVEKDVAEIKRLVNEHEEELRVDDVNSPMYNIWHDTHNTFGLSGILNDLADCTDYRNSLQNFIKAMKKHVSERLDKGITVAFWKALTAPHMVGGRSKAFWTYFYEYIASEVAEDSTTRDDFFNILDTINALLLFPTLKTKFMQEYNKIIDSPYTVIKQSEEDN